MNKYIYLFSAVMNMCVCQASLAQMSAADSSSRQSALNNAITLYNTSLGYQAPIFTGPEYYSYPPYIKGNACFLDVNAFTPGSVYYDGTLYSHIFMLYDLYTDQVAIMLPNHVSKFNLLKERVKSFDFLKNHFINIDADTLNNNTILKSGYYDQLYKGKLEVLAKYAKSIQTSTSSISGLENYFSSSKDYYLGKDNSYQTINSQGALLDILKDKKKELKQYIKANKIRYRDNPEEAMVKIATYYDHLTN